MSSVRRSKSELKNQDLLVRKPANNSKAFLQRANHDRTYSGYFSPMDKFIKSITALDMFFSDLQNLAGTLEKFSRLFLFYP